MSVVPWMGRLLLLTCVVGCGDGRRAGAPDVQRDTLPGGAVVVENGPEGRWTRDGSVPWRLTEDLRIGRIDGDTPDVFGSVRNVVPIGDTLIWVMDSRSHELRAFDGNGNFVRTVGGQGDGPGEFGFNPCASSGPDDEVWVEAGGRWQRFAPDGELLGGQQVTRSLGCGITAWRGDDFLAAFAVRDPATREVTRGLVVHDRAQDGSVVVRDTASIPEIAEARSFQWLQDGRPRMSSYIPLVHHPRQALQSSGDFLVTDGGPGYRFRKETPWGDTVLVVGRAYEPVAVPDSVRDAEIAALDREPFGLPVDYDPQAIPSVYPPFERLLEARDGTVWAQRRIAEGGIAFDVFEEDGTFLGTVGLPVEYAGMVVREVTATSLFAVVRDDFDVQYMVRFAIERPLGG